MQWANDQRSYGWLSIALHWLAAVGVILMLTTGFRADLAADAGDRATRAMVMSWHISIGATFAFIFLARIAASYAQTRPAAPPQKPPLPLLANLTHHGLLLALLLQVISGPLAVWSGGRPINVFGVLSIPGPFAERSEGVHELAELIHAIGRWAIVALLSLHVLAVLKHAMIDRDGVLQRMLIAGRGL
jgi:cytochrome b561